MIVLRIKILMHSSRLMHHRYLAATGLNLDYRF